MSSTPEMEAFIDGRVASGRFRGAGGVVRPALRLLEGDGRKRQGRARNPGRERRARTGAYGR